MAATRQTDEHARAVASPATLRRRGLIAGAAALVAGLIAQRAATPVAADATGTALLIGGPSGNGAVQAGSNMTWLGSSALLPNGPTLRVTNAFTGGLDNKGDGLQGYATGSGRAGVFGRNNDAGGTALWGEAPGGTGAFGHSAAATGVGVVGQSDSYIGVYGTSAAYGIYGNGGVYGVYGATAAGAGANAAGVYGIAGTANGYGVIGIASAPATTAAYFGGATITQGSATVNAPANSHGLVATPTAAGYAGVLGQAVTAGAIGVYGSTGLGTAYAGYFTGRVVVSGDFSVTGAKSAAVPHPDGTHRLLYCVEAPEAWFEDFGEGTLVNGVAAVALDPDFAAVVDTKQLHVFFTETGGHHALHLSAKDGKGFTVRADATALVARGKQPGDANGTFSYRVVARRKDQPGKRFATHNLPAPQPSPPSPPSLKPTPPLQPTVPKPRADAGR